MKKDQLITEAWWLGWLAANKVSRKMIAGPMPTKKEIEKYAAKELDAAIKLLGEKQYAE